MASRGRVELNQVSNSDLESKINVLNGHQFFELSSPATFAQLLERARGQAQKPALRSRGGVALRRSTSDQGQTRRGAR